MCSHWMGKAGRRLDDLKKLANCDLLLIGGKQPDKLQKVTVPVITDAQCQKDLEPADFTVTDDMICAGEAGTDTCQVNCK